MSPSSFTTLFFLQLTQVVNFASASWLMRKEGRSELRMIVEKVLQGMDAQRLFDVEASVRKTYEAFPKDSRGLVPMQAIHAIAHSYFIEEHGWVLKGFEYTSEQSTKLQSAAIIQEKMPDVARAIISGERRKEGLSMGDVVSIVAAVEQIVMAEQLPLLQAAYTLNRLSSTEKLDDVELDKVLTSYLIIFRQGRHSNHSDFQEHELVLEHARKSVDWERIVNFERAVVEALPIAGDGGFSFDQVASMVKTMLLQYGNWQDMECSEIKERLVEMVGDSSGMVPFNQFASEPPRAHFRFGESLEYLRAAGVLDETDVSDPKVLIPNYVASSSNCIASSTYYSVCCLSECELILNALEGKVASSESDVPVDELLQKAAEIETPTVKVPRMLSSGLKQEAETLAEHHGGGVVPLHSGDFRLWLHHAFPNECPRPSSEEVRAEDRENDLTERWLGRNRIPTWHISAVADFVDV